MKSLGLGISLLLVGLLCSSAFNFFTYGKMDPVIQPQEVENSLAELKHSLLDTADLQEQEILAISGQGQEAASADFNESPQQRPHP